ncbi:MAG: endopeptidase La [Acidimicrobiia bacterium]|nr:endopeptidase La [Acidimicrobiia bacterium]
MADTRTKTLPVLPLHNGVIGPQMVVTIAAESPEARRAADDAAAKADSRVLLVPRVDGAYARVGTVAVIEQDGDLPNGQRALVVRGLERAVLGSGRSDLGDALWVDIEPVDGGVVSNPEVDRLVREYRATVEAVLEHRGARQLAEAITQLNDPSAVADLALYSPDLDFSQKVEVLETLDVEARLRRVLGWMKEVLADLSVRDELRRNLEEEVGKEQREAVLRRQMAAIQKELGDAEDGEGLVARYRAQLEDSGAPEAVRAEIQKELDKLARTPAQNPEHGWIVAWLDTIFELPWGTRVEDDLDLGHAREVLDADHAGLEKVKERIIEYIAVRRLRAERGVGSGDGEPAGRSGQGTIIALVGPPGVGKTSLGASIARALGRPFARVALGGVRDEAEVRGHRRTYVGARPGRFVRALTEAGAMNPVLLLDEVDKVGSDWRGDPSSALLEVLDPAQNHTFRDHYLEVDLDLSDVVFIATANQLETVPAPLLDRLEIIGLEGYIDDEKVAIARHHLLPRLLERTGIREGEVVVTDEALRAVVVDHTREAGVRELERQLNRVIQKLATRLATDAPESVVVDEAMVTELLGKPRFREEVAERTSSPGVATGLAVTGVGGGILFIEATAMDGDPGLTLTGQLGDVMKESAEIARSYVRANKATLGLEDDAVDTKRLHVHVPAGATPKDGPSAGVTMTTALVSLLSGRPVKPTVGMTGEVTLQGKVLPIGGVRQKLLAAHRAGLTEVVIPARNEPDLDDVPEGVREDLTIHLASDVRDVIGIALS